jgi:hypothetical protein
MQALPYFSRGLEFLASASKREEENKQKLAEARKVRDAAAREADKAKEEAQC